MVAPVNDFDATLQAESPRTLASSSGVILSATSNVVTVDGSGNGSPAIITLVATPLVGKVGSVVFSTSPTVPLSVDASGLIATLRAVDMGSSSVVVTVTATINNLQYTDTRSISRIAMGSLGYTGALDATRNNTAQGLLANRPAGANGDFYFATDALVLYQKVGGAWQVAGNNFTNTSQLTDGAGLGQTAIWGNVSGPNRPQDNANYTSASKGAALNDDPAIENLASWSLGSDVAFRNDASGGAVSKNYLFCASGTDRFAHQIRRFSVDPKRSYNLTAVLFADAANNRSMFIYVNFYTAADPVNPMPGQGAGGTGWGGSMSGYTFGGLPPAGSWARVGSVFGANSGQAIPAGAVEAEVGVWFQYSGGGSSSVTQAFQDLRCEDVTLQQQALVTLNAISSDGVLSKGEKPQVVLDYNAIYYEQNDLQAKANSLSVSHSALDSAYAALGTYLSSLGGSSADWSNTSLDTTIDGPTFRQKFIDYYTAKQALINAMAAKNKALADAAQSTADAANAAIAVISSDNMLSKGEKPQVILDVTAISNEKPGLIQKCADLSVDSGPYQAAYNALSNYLPVGWNDLATDTAIDGATFRQKFIDYYAAKQALINALAASAATQSTWTGTSGRPADDQIRNNMADLSWWKRGASLPWNLNAEYNYIVDSQADCSVPGPKGVAESVWFCQETTGDSADGGGWNNAPLTLDPTKTYRFVLPIRRLLGTGSAYWGINEGSINNLNDTLNPSGSPTYPNLPTAANPYFANASGLSTDRWYLFIGYIFPAGSTGNTHGGSGIWDCKTGQQVASGLNFNFKAGVTSIEHRAYQYYASLNAQQVFGRPMINLVDGTEPALRDYFGGAVLGQNVAGQINPSNSAALIAAQTINLAHINTATIGSLSALTAIIGSFSTGGSGARTDINDYGMKCYGDNAGLRVTVGRIGS